MGQKILIVEDNEGDQLLITEAIGESCFDCEFATAATGEEAVEKVSLEKPDIVILDTQLPGMNGFETCRKIKEICGDAVKVIIMTGVVDAIDAGRARDAGADDYAAKTSEGESILECLEGLIDQKVEE